MWAAGAAAAERVLQTLGPLWLSLPPVRLSCAAVWVPMLPAEQCSSKRRQRVSREEERLSFSPLSFEDGKLLTCHMQDALTFSR